MPVFPYLHSRTASLLWPLPFVRQGYIIQPWLVCWRETFEILVKILPPLIKTRSWNSRLAFLSKGSRSSLKRRGRCKYARLVYILGPRAGIPSLTCSCSSETVLQTLVLGTSSSLSAPIPLGSPFSHQTLGWHQDGASHSPISHVLFHCEVTEGLRCPRTSQLISHSSMRFMLRIGLALPHGSVSSLRRHGPF